MQPTIQIRPRPEVAAMEGYHSPQVSVAVRLNTNESPFPPPQEFERELAELVGGIAFHRYPDRAARDLRKAIAALHGVDPGQVFAANGSNEVLQTLCLTYAGHGRKVLTFEPTYALHSHIARISGATVVSRDRRPDFTLSVDDVMRAIDEEQPDVVFLCSPNNPTGLAEPRELVEAVVDAARGLVVVDEAYGQFASWSAQTLLSESRNLAVVRTYSKTWALAALRLGYLLGPSWLVEDLEAVVLPYHLDSIKQAAGTLALRYEDDMRARVEELVAERQRLVAALNGLAVDVWRSEANFVLFRPRDVHADLVWQRLVDSGVLVRNCASWAGLDGCLRVTIGTRGENDVFLQALQQALAVPGSKSETASNSVEESNQKESKV